MKPTKICTIDGCSGMKSPKAGKGMCAVHYRRWYTHGDIEGKRCETCAKPLHLVFAVIKGQRFCSDECKPVCAVPGCDGVFRNFDWCKTHYSQWRTTGEATPFKHKWGEGGYDAIHHQLRGKFGSASGHVCVDCGNSAEEWSYDGECTNELTDDRGVTYSRDLERYAARCIRCHRLFDGWRDKVTSHRI